MPSVRVAPTPALSPDELAQIRAILDEAFAGDFSDHDWDHALGGVHVMAYDGDELVGHGSVVERLLEHDGMPLRTGYLEGMGVSQSHRRRGHGDAIMAVVEDQIRARFQLGALAATDDGARLYLSRGWVRWTGRTDPGAERALFVLPLAVPVDPRGTLRADRRDGDIW